MVVATTSAVIDIEALAARFGTDGFVAAPLYNPAEVAIIRGYALDWVGGLMREAYGGAALPGPIEDYHRWQTAAAIDHGAMLRAPKRHCVPPSPVAEALLNQRLWQLLGALAPDRALSIWDEGLGWLGFRLIRPGVGDGYPWSCKAWGPAKSVLSVWIPVIGGSARETLALWPGSHRLELDSFLPEDSKFTKDERRLRGEPPAEAVRRPDLTPGQAVVFGPQTIHSEDVTDSTLTRLNLELRIAVTPKASGPC